MKYYKTMILKDHKKCILKSATGFDAKEVYDHFKLTHSETDYLLSYPDENSFNIEQERQFLIKKEESAREIEICAIVDNQIVGTAGIDSKGRHYKVKHRCEVGISIEKRYWGKGIGRGLLEACIECAQLAGYQQIELEVVSENLGAIALYKSVGFQEYGRNPKGFLSRYCGWQEVVLMRLEIGE